VYCNDADATDFTESEFEPEEKKPKAYAELDWPF
jgi:hypothetical protein